MNLFKIGDMTINMDRVNGIQDHVALPEDQAHAPRTTIRLLFDDSHIDLHGQDAQVLRRWIRHNARNLAPHKNEDGEALLQAEDQLRKVADHLCNLVDHVRPRDPALRNTTHRLSSMIDDYMTGELPPVSVKSFERHFDALRDPHTIEDVSRDV